jgi:hypothetical protein
VENFLVVQSVELRNAQRSRNPAQIRSSHCSSPSSCTAAWPRCEARLDHFVWEDIRRYRASRRRTESLRLASPRGAAREAASSQKPVPKMKDPSGGTTGRVKPYGALGVDGRSRRIQPMGRDNRSHIDRSQPPRRTFKTPGDFFNLLFGAIAAKITVQQAISRRLRPICPMPSTAGGHSAPGSRKRYRQTGQAPAFFLPQACLKPKQAEPPARRSPR